ncbi:MAG: hypothetical protein QXY52_04975 [Conexivisphaerales archaeon]
MKALFFIVAGDDCPERFSVGLTIAARSVINKRYDDLKVLFFGPAEEHLTKVTGMDLENFKILNDSGNVDSACIAVANSKNIKEQLTNMGINLVPTGERLAHFVNSGYQVITF